MSNSLTLEEQVIAALRRITRAIDLHSRLLLQKYGLTAPQLAALYTIQRKQPIAVGALAKEIHLSQGTVTGILDRLEKRGLVVRTRGNQDRRSVLVELTEAGDKLVLEAPSLISTEPAGVILPLAAAVASMVWVFKPMAIERQLDHPEVASRSSFARDFTQ